MATIPTSPILRYVRQFASSQLAELSDTHLLERFTSRSDEAAFAALVRRHGPLVLGVCRRVLRDWHSAEDCFQVTFMLLARKASSLSRPEALGPWLYGVASRTARKAKTQAMRRRLKEAQVHATEAVDAVDDSVWRDLRPLLDESVNGLPEKYRVPFVLHYMQGVTVSEVARRLGCPRDSVASRLTRARERLRERLTRRGLTLSAGCLLMALSEASVSVPASLVLPAAHAAAQIAASQAGTCLFSARIVPFTEGVLAVMRTTKVKIAAVGLLLAALLGVGAGMSGHRDQAMAAENLKAKAPALAGGKRDKPARKPRVRFLSLAEAKAIALDNLVSTPQGSDAVRVLAKPGAEGIVVVGIRRDVQRERDINQLLFNVESAYWNLYGSYWQLYSREQGLRFAYEAWKITAAKLKVGTATRGSLAQAEGQYNLFRSQRLQAIDTVLDNERQLRAMLGMSAEKPGAKLSELLSPQPLQATDTVLDDKGQIRITSAKQMEAGVNLVPSDAPTVVEQRPDWDKALTEALKQRPEMRLARRDVKIAEGNPPEQARAFLALQDQELKAERFLGLYYRRLSTAYRQIKAARVQRDAFATQLRVQYGLYRADSNDPATSKRITLNLLLEVHRFWSDALATEYQAIVTYNNALAGWEYGKGSSMAYGHVRFAEEMPSDDEEVRAVEQERDQTREKVRREQAAPVDWSSTAAKSDGQAVRKGALVLSLPSLWKTTPPVEEADELPPADGEIDVDKWLHGRSALK